MCHVLRVIHALGNGKEKKNGRYYGGACLHVGDNEKQSFAWKMTLQLWPIASEKAYIFPWNIDNQGKNILGRRR